MPNQITRGLEVFVESCFVPEQSSPEQNQFVFAYRIRLRNHGDMALKLISRHWVITDSTGEINEVRGEGVVGQQPVLKPGDSYEYTSGSHLHSPLGTMHGTYQMITEEGEVFDAAIPVFRLMVPGVLQ